MLRVKGRIKCFSSFLGSHYSGQNEIYIVSKTYIHFVIMLLQQFFILFDVCQTLLHFGELLQLDEWLKEKETTNISLERYSRLFYLM